MTVSSVPASYKPALSVAHPVVRSDGEQDTTSSEWITPSCLNMRPTRRATVVLPVPGAPVNRKFMLMACRGRQKITRATAHEDARDQTEHTTKRQMEFPINVGRVVGEGRGRVYAVRDDTPVARKLIMTHCLCSRGVGIAALLCPAFGIVSVSGSNTKAIVHTSRGSRPSRSA